MSKVITILALAFLLSACAHFKGAKMNGLRLGMSKAAVIQQLGKPDSFGASPGVETLHYMDDRGWGKYDYYFVRLVDGNVESFGPESLKSHK